MVNVGSGGRHGAKELSHFGGFTLKSGVTSGGLCANSAESIKLTRLCEEEMDLGHDEFVMVGHLLGEFGSKGRKVSGTELERPGGRIFRKTSGQLEHFIEQLIRRVHALFPIT